MKRLAALLAAVPLFGTVTLTASQALADSSAQGTAYSVTTFNRSSDNYSSFHGYVLVGSQYYLWGGSSYCSSYPYDPSDTDIQLINSAVVNKKTLGVSYKQGSYYPCLTGITVNSATATSSTSSTSTPTPPAPNRR